MSEKKGQTGRIFAMSVSDMLYAKTLRSTDKKMTAEGENEDDDPDCGLTDCTVSSSDIPDFVDASTSPESNNMTDGVSLRRTNKKAVFDDQKFKDCISHFGISPTPVSAKIPIEGTSLGTSEGVTNSTTGLIFYK